MWEFKYRPNKKVVEARSNQGANLLLVVDRRKVTLSMSGPAWIQFGDVDDFTNEMNKTIKIAQEILVANGN